MNNDNLSAMLDQYQAGARDLPGYAELRELCASVAAPVAAVPAEPNLKNGFPYQDGLDIKAVLYTDAINDKQVCRDDLWLATTDALNALRVLPEPIPAAPIDRDSVLETLEEWSERLDNVLAASNIPMPAHIHAKALSEVIETLHAEMGAVISTVVSAAPLAVSQAAEQIPETAAKPSDAGDPMPKRTAFLAWCKSRGLDTDTDKDAWGALKFKHSHIQAMWEGWFNAPTATPPIPAPVEAKKPMTYDEFFAEAKRTGLTADALIPGVVARLSEMEAQGVIRKHEDGGHEFAPTKAAEGSIGDDPEFRIRLAQYNIGELFESEFIEYIDTLLAASKTGPAKLTEWISVEDRLPPKNSGFLLVTNNLTAETAFGTMSHIWLALMIHPQDDGSFAAFAHPTTSRVEGITHWKLVAAITTQPGERK